MLQNTFIWKISGLYKGIQPNYFGPLILTPTEIYFISLETAWDTLPTLKTMLAKGMSVSQQIKTEKQVRDKLDTIGLNLDKLDQMLYEYDHSVKINKLDILSCTAKGFSYRLFTIKTNQKSYTFDLLESYKNHTQTSNTNQENNRKEINKTFFRFLSDNNYPFKTNWWGI